MECSRAIGERKTKPLLAEERGDEGAHSCTPRGNDEKSTSECISVPSPHPLWGIPCPTPSPFPLFTNSSAAGIMLLRDSKMQWLRVRCFFVTKTSCLQVQVFPELLILLSLNMRFYLNTATYLLSPLSAWVQHRNLILLWEITVLLKFQSHGKCANLVTQNDFWFSDIISPLISSTT